MDVGGWVFDVTDREIDFGYKRVKVVCSRLDVGGWMLEVGGWLEVGELYVCLMVSAMACF